MPQQSPFASQTQVSSSIRFAPVVHLQTGETKTLIAETEQRFEERAVFGRAAIAAECSGASHPSPAAWLAAHIEMVANDAHERTVERPVIVSAPLAALVHADTPLACDAAIRRTHLCAQEICIEISDAALALPGADTQTAIEKLRRCGFRISLDARQSWHAPLDASLRLLLDGLRIDARNLESEPELEDRVEAAVACGMTIIAENAPWRDGDYLASIGIDYGLRPRTDA